MARSVAYLGPDRAELPLDGAVRERLLNRFESLGEEGYRVLGIASRAIEGDAIAPSDEGVDARDRDIIVTMPGTSFRVVFRKPHRGSQLVARLDYFQDQQKGPITRAEFIARRRNRGRARVQS